MSDTYRQMLDTAAACGINVISKEHAAQLMAVVYLYGDESAVYSEKMRTDIQHVAKQYGLYGGGTPDGEFVTMVGSYAYSIKRDMCSEWLPELERRYDITLPKHEEYKPPKGTPKWR